MWQLGDSIRSCSAVQRRLSGKAQSITLLLALIEPCISIGLCRFLQLPRGFLALPTLASPGTCKSICITWQCEGKIPPNYCHIKMNDFYTIL